MNGLKVALMALSLCSSSFASASSASYLSLKSFEDFGNEVSVTLNLPCGDHSNVLPMVMESLPIQVAFVEESSETCTSFVNEEVTVTFSKNELGLNPLEPFKVLNPIESQNEQALWQGFDIYGQATSCATVDESNLVCTMEWTEQDEFAARCEEQGGQALVCGCHNYLCSEPVQY